MAEAVEAVETVVEVEEAVVVAEEAAAVEEGELKFSPPFHSGG